MKQFIFYKIIIPLIVTAIFIYCVYCAWIISFSFGWSSGMMDADKIYIDYLMTQHLNSLSSSPNRATEEEGDKSANDSINTDGVAGQVVETTDEIKAYIVEVAENYGVNSELALKIAECESNFKNVCNYSCGCECGIGIYQLVQSTFDEAVEKMIKEDSYQNKSESQLMFVEMIKINTNLSPYNPKDNIDIALWLMSEGYYEKWDASEDCWQPTFWRVNGFRN